MNARTESKFQRGPLLWLAAAVWLCSGQLAWALAAAGERETFSPERMQETYRQILAAWSAGEVQKAPDDLIALETAVIADGEPRTRKLLLAAEQEVIHQVGAADIEVLVPIAMLHHESYRRLILQGARGRAMALSHARSMARDLAILYREQSGSEGAALVSSQLLTSLGGMLLSAAQQLPAAEMFEQAIELDGRNVVALLALAAIYEKNAQTESAVKLLFRALEVDGNHPEVRLRLGINLKRQGKDKEARTILEKLAGEEDFWLSAIAYQELAQLHREQGRGAEAEKVLRRAVQAYPDDPRFYIQLAAVLDQRGAAKESTELIEKVLSAPSQPVAVSGRYLYNQFPPDAFAEARAFLDENSRSRLPVLAQALNGPPVEASAAEVGR
ncbi:MAG TPA: tetratricopeptide repeat protein [Thermoanaerobaculia bacterium]